MKRQWMQKGAILVGMIALLLGVSSLMAQGSHETESSIAELDAFHEVIYPIWHTAYPDKDIKALKGFVGQINELAGKIYAAKLPHGSSAGFRNHGSRQLSRLAGLAKTGIR